MVLPNDIAALIGFATEAVLWGAYAILFGISLITLRHRRSKTGSATSPVIMFMNCMLFASCTAHFALEYNHFHTYLWANGVEGYANETPPLVAADTFISLCDLLGDFVLIYRCWILWQKNFLVIALPLLTAISGFACSMAVIHLVVTVTPTAPVPSPSIVPLGTAGFVLPLCTNFLTTILIVFRIWWLTRPSGASGSAVTIPTLRSTSRVAHGVMEVVVESGLIYLATQFIFVILFAVKHPAEAIVAVAAVQIYGIASTLIIIRVALGIATEDTTDKGGDFSTSLEWASGPRLRHPATSTGIHSSYISESDGTRVDLEGKSVEMKTRTASNKSVASEAYGA